MSEIVVCETYLSDSGCLKKALVDIGVPAEAVSSSETEIVIDGALIGATSKIRFEKQADGTYRGTFGNRLLRNGMVAKMLSTAHGGTGELAQHYAKRMIFKEVKTQYGQKIKSCKQKDGKIRIRLTAA
jgi:hypothetical protein